MRAFILAGGFATRLWPLTEKRAKPLLPLAGIPILTHLLGKIPAAIPATVSTNATFRLGFEEWIRGFDRTHVELVIEDTQHDDHKLGALGALSQWITGRGIQEDILVLTGDNYLGFSLDAFIAAYQPGTALLAAHDIGDLAKASAFGTVLTHPNDPHTVGGFEEKPREPKTTLVSTGCSILPATAFQILVGYAEHHPDNVGGIFEEFLRQGIPVRCFTFSEPWLDIGSFSSYLDAHRLLVAGRAIVHPSASLAGGETHGSIVIGESSTVTRTHLTDAIVFDRCVIDDCILRNCVVDDDCVLRGVDLSDKMIRAGTVLELT